MLSWRSFFGLVFLFGQLAGRATYDPDELPRGIIVIVTGAALGYLAFWAFFFLKLLGKIFCYGAYALSATMLFSSVRSKFALKATAKQVAEPLLYTTLAGLCYLCFFFLFVDPAQASIYASERFFVEIFPGDNVIPHILAEKIYSREPVRPFCCGDWLSSDLLLLEAGIVLLERLFPLTKNIDLRYELLTSAIQCFWICGVWCLLKALDTPVRRCKTRVSDFLGFSVFQQRVYLAETASGSHAPVRNGYPPSSTPDPPGNDQSRSAHRRYLFGTRLDVASRLCLQSGGGRHTSTMVPASLSVEAVCTRGGGCPRFLPSLERLPEICRPAG